MSKHARILSDDEFDALVAHVESKRNGARNRLVVYLTHYAGMRIGEVAGLLLSDLVGRSYNGTADFYADNVGYTVVPQIQLRKRAVKGKHARSVVLSKRVRAEIVRYFASLPSITLTDALCVGYKGQITNKTLALMLRDWMRELGLYGASSHSGRRRFVTELLERGTNIRTVQQLVGHKFLTTTQLYADCLPSRMLEAVEAL